MRLIKVGRTYINTAYFGTLSVTFDMENQIIGLDMFFVQPVEGTDSRTIRLHQEQFTNENYEEKVAFMDELASSISKSMNADSTTPIDCDEIVSFAIKMRDTPPSESGYTYLG